MSEMNNTVKKTYTIAFYTYLDIIRSKILVNVGILGFVLLLITYVAFQFTYGSPTKIALDFGLGALTLSSVGIAIFFGANLLSKEIENRTIHMIISRPVSRASFIIGKILGLCAVMILNILLLSCLTLSVYFFAGGSFQAPILWAIVFILFEAILVLLSVVFLSLFTSQTLSILLALTLYFVGHAMGNVFELSFVQNNSAVKTILNIYKFILPAYYSFNLKEVVIYKQSVEIRYLILTSLYWFCYTLALLMGCIFVLKRKNLD